MTPISVIITTHNRLTLLKKAIDSVKNAGEDLEIIVVDDASSDNTQNYCDNLEGIKYIRVEKNQKTAGARNIGIAASTSPYIAFLDDDDWRLADSYNEQRTILDNNPSYGLVCGAAMVSDQNGVLTKQLYIPSYNSEENLTMELLRNNFIILSSVLIRRECFYKIGLFDQSVNMVGIEDWDMWIRISEYYQIYPMPIAVCVYRKPETNSAQWSSNISRQYILAGKAFKKKWSKSIVLQDSLSRNNFFEKRKILNRIADMIVYDVINNTHSFVPKVKKMIAAANCYPRKILQKNFYKVLGKNVILGK